MIGRANGVGPKLAARIANELQGKLGVAGLGGARARAARRSRRRRPLRARQPRLQARRSQRRRQCRAGRARRRRDARRAGPARAEESGEMTARTASCRCGQLTRHRRPAIPCAFRSATASTARSGRAAPSPSQARWPSRAGADRGSVEDLRHGRRQRQPRDFPLLPRLRVDVHYEIDGKFDDQVAIPLGAFDDPMS